MLIQLRRAKWRVIASVMLLLAVFFPGGSDASVSFTYDQLGRVTTALYDNGACIAYSYDASSNRTSQTNTVSAAPESPIWGAGVWGCFVWTP